MPSKDLYLLAVECKKRKLSDLVSPRQLVAVGLPDRVPAYLWILALYPSEPILTVFPDAASLGTFYRTFAAMRDRTPDVLSGIVLEENSVRCEFVNKSDLTEADRKETAAYGLELRGRCAYPMFERRRPRYIPWIVEEPEDEALMKLALEAALEIARKLEFPPASRGAASSKRRMALMDELGFSDDAFAEAVPFLTRRPDGTFSWGIHHLPACCEPEEDIFEFDDGPVLHELRRKKRSGVWECGIFLTNVPEFLYDELVDGELVERQAKAPFFPHALMIVDHASGEIVRALEANTPEQYRSDLLDIFIYTLRTVGVPREVLVGDDRTRRLLMGVAGQMSLRVTAKENLPRLGKAIEEYRAEAAAEYDGVLRRSERARSAKGERKGSYVISAVPERSACARHIRISASATLDELHGAILSAFDFDDDHAHAFFMDNRAWSLADAYVMRGMEMTDRYTDDCALGDLNLRANRKFLFLFDFGEEWRFQCQVLKALREDTPEPEVVFAEGEAPEQYPDEDADGDDGLGPEE